MEEIYHEYGIVLVAAIAGVTLMGFLVFWFYGGDLYQMIIRHIQHICMEGCRWNGC